MSQFSPQLYKDATLRSAEKQAGVMYRGFVTQLLSLFFTPESLGHLVQKFLQKQVLSLSWASYLKNWGCNAHRWCLLETVGWPSGCHLPRIQWWTCRCKGSPSGTGRAVCEGHVLGGWTPGACLSFPPVAFVARVYSHPLTDPTRGADHWCTLGQGFRPPLFTSYLGMSVLLFTVHYGSSKERFKYISAYSSCQGRKVDLHALESSSPGKVKKCEVDWLNLRAELTQIRSIVIQTHRLPCGSLCGSLRGTKGCSRLSSLFQFSSLIVSLIRNTL